MRSIVLVGPSGSGKSLCASRLSAMGYTRIEASAPMAGKIPRVRPSERIPHVEKYFEENGREVIADWLASILEKEDSNTPVVVSGCRQPQEIQAVRRFRPHTLVIAIHAELEMRFEWLKIRGREDAPLTREELFKLTSWEMALGLGSVLYASDVVIFNNSNLEDLWTSVRKVARDE